MSALDNLKAINEFVSRASQAPSQSHVFRISMDAATGKMKVEVKQGFMMAGDDGLKQETEQQQSVVVNVNRVADLKRAFPNYYLDLGAFVRHLSSAVQFLVSPPKTAIATPSLDKLDLSFLSRWRAAR